MFSLCRCGCGKEVINEKHLYIRGHHRIGKMVSDDIKLKISESVSLNYKNHPDTALRIKNSLIGKKLSKAHKLKISNSLIGRSVSKNIRMKISATLKGRQTSSGMLGKNHSDYSKLKCSKSNIGKKRSVDTKIKQSISAIKRIEMQFFNGGVIFPREGLNEKIILDQLQNSIDILIDRNNRKLAEVTGKFNDGFIHEYNIGLEVLEPEHFNSAGELKDYDKNRELLIASKLGCMIYYIPEQEFLKNPEKEIQRFKDFVDVVKIC